MGCQTKTVVVAAVDHGSQRDYHTNVVEKAPINLTSVQNTPLCTVCSSENMAKRAVYGSYNLYACRRCGHHQCHPLPSSDELSRFYEESYYTASPERPYNADPRFVEKRYRKMSEIIKGLDPPVRSLYEFGCSSGHGLKQLQLAGFKVTGIEAAGNFAEHARNKLGLDVDHGMSLPANRHHQFDCGLSLHVIEHIPEPRGHLNDLLKVIRPGGWLVIATPNSAFWPVRLSRMWNWLQPMHHLQIFSPESMKLLLEQAGLAEVKVRTFVDCPEHNHLANVIADTLKYGPYRLPDLPDALLKKRLAAERTFLTRVRYRLGHDSGEALKALSFPLYNLLRLVFPSWRESILAIARQRSE